MRRKDIVLELKIISRRCFGEILVMPENSTGKPTGVYDLGRHLVYIADCFSDSSLVTDDTDSGSIIVPEESES